MRKIIVYYHKNCPDGFSGAWVARKKFGDKAQYIGCNPVSIPTDIKGSDIYIIDNSPTLEVYKKLISQGNSVVILDHHKSFGDIKDQFSNAVYSDKKCGATLAWEYFFPKKKIPLFLKYVEAGDTWRFSLPKSDVIKQVINVLPFEYDVWDAIAKKIETKEGKKKIAEEGNIILKHTEALVRQIAREAEPAEFLGCKAYVVNTPILRSDTGDFICKHFRVPVAILWYEEKEKVHISLRNKDKSVDVSELARRFKNGGGHPRAAGFCFPANKKKPWKIIKK